MTEIDTGHGAPSSDDEFEALARRAMGELKRPAPERGMDAVRSRGQRRQMTGTVMKVVGTVAVLVLGGVLIARAGGDDADKAPATPATTVAPVVPATTAATPATTPPPVLDGEAWIAYLRSTGSRFEVYLVRPDGTGAHPLVPDLASRGIQHADWAPDGSQLVLSVADDTGDAADDLWTVKADGTGARRLVDCTAPCIGLNEAAWSPDGRSIVYVRQEERAGTVTARLDVVDLASGATRTLLTAPAGQVYSAPRWSPDGTRLVIESVTFADATDEEPVADAIGIVEVADPGAGVRLITDPTSMSFFPDWSPSGDLILYTSKVPGSVGRDLFTIRPDGTGATRLTKFANTGAAVNRPTFTPDGTAILFSWTAASTPTVLLSAVKTDGTQMAWGGTEPLVGDSPRLRPGTSLS